MKKHAILPLLFLLAGFVFAEDEKINIAVNDLSVEGMESAASPLLSDRLRNELFRTGEFNVLERSEMEGILKEQGFQQSGCTTDECAIEIGKILNVSHIIAGTIGLLGKMYMISVRVIEVSSGKIAHTASIDCKCPIEEVVSTSMKEIAYQIKYAVARARFCGLNILTNPPGAAVLLNKKNMGSTPFRDERLKPGSHDIELMLPTYNVVQKSLDLQKGKIENLSFNLSHTQQYLDSVENEKKRLAEVALEKDEEEKKRVAEEKKRKRKRGLIFSRVLFGSLAAGSAVTSIVMNSKVQENVDEKEEIYNDYSSATSDFDTYKKDYNKANDEAEKSVKIRNAFYVIAGFSCAGFALTFTF